MLPEELTEALKSRARELGADHVGVAPAAPPSPSEGGPDALQAWVAKGMHGEMGYMARSPEDRSDITRWFPAARSVVLCAFSYHDGRRHEPKPGHGRLARYALPPDYHDELKSRMEALRDWVRERGGDGRVFVDTSPVLERLYARYAGVGWVGKNTMILSRRIGSFFLLAGLAVDRELKPDEPVPDHCGTCTRCLDACPTGAFPAPRVLDASRCVAYFTVEQRKSPVPEAFRAGHGDWVFGCDACQDVCPWNRFAVRGSVFTPRLPADPDLEELAGLSPEEFNRRFKGTPLRRTGWAAVTRNVLLAMGNSRDPRHRRTLERYAAHENPTLAEQARWSLDRLAEGI